MLSIKINHKSLEHSDAPNQLFYSNDVSIDTLNEIMHLCIQINNLKHTKHQIKSLMLNYDIFVPGCLCEWRPEYGQKGLLFEPSLNPSDPILLRQILVNEHDDSDVIESNEFDIKKLIKFCCKNI